jgi:hypothetical protein
MLVSNEQAEQCILAFKKTTPNAHRKTTQDSQLAIKYECGTYLYVFLLQTESLFLGLYME